MKYNWNTLNRQLDVESRERFFLKNSYAGRVKEARKTFFRTNTIGGVPIITREKY